MSPKDVLALVKAKGLKIVDVKFIDLPGTWQHFSIPATELSESIFDDGLGFDGSSIRGFQKINESDMLLIPDPSTAVVDPACKIPTLSLICDIKDPLTGNRYSRDPRYVARKAEDYLKTTGIGDTIYFGPEAEFYIFNSISFDQTSHGAFYAIDSEEGIWNSGQPGLGYRPRYKEGYFPVPPTDKLQDLRSEMILKMEETGIKVEVQHHEVGTAGQAEIDMRFTTLTRMADQLMMYKYIVKNVAYQNGYTATFMPKPIFGDNGSGMHCHQSIWKGEVNQFFDAAGYAQISDTCRWYIGGLLKHVPSILAFAAPTTNSYRRLVPGFEAPVNLMYSARNRSACIRIPMLSSSPKAKRLEFRIPDPSCNPYLAFAAMMMAGLDGIQNKIEPPTPLEKDLYDLEPEEAAKVKSAPGSLAEVLDALDTDHGYLLKGDVFTRDLIENWIEFKHSQMVQLSLRPHPYEFHLYYDV
ncbi:MAG: type I glutamate--ammonia ligase [Chloroflexota bacterium]